jgi:hypothetical protein
MHQNRGQPREKENGEVVCDAHEKVTEEGRRKSQYQRNPFPHHVADSTVN